MTGSRNQSAQDRALRVLIVDDHPMMRTALTEMFEDEDGLTVVGECADGSEAVEATARLSPDVVCMDVSMPTMDGVAATEALRAARADVRIVMFTGSPMARPLYCAFDPDIYQIVRSFTSKHPSRVTVIRAPRVTEDAAADLLPS